MNLFLHTTVAISTASLIATKINRVNINKLYFSAVSINILLHGLLDILPHDYPLSMKNDIIVSLFISLVYIFWIKHKTYRILAITCIISGALPDIIDKGGRIALNLFGIKTRHYLFPWHWNNVINQTYDFFYIVQNSDLNSINLNLHIYQIAIVSLSLIILLINRKPLKNLYNKHHNKVL